jgi:hypothetical protein
VLLASALAAPGVGLAQTAPARKDLALFKNFFVTGDYVAAGVSLEGKGVGGMARGEIEIAPDAIPPDAEVIAAYLYWQSITPTGAPQAANRGAKFRGNPLAFPDPRNPLDTTRTNVTTVNRVGSATCSSNGGATGDANGSRAVYVHRADVLRYLPRVREEIAGDGAGAPKQYRFAIRATGRHSVELPDGLDSNKLPSALGASLILVYRTTGYYPDADPNLNYTVPRQPLRSVVIYEGGHTMNNARPNFEVQLDGFYQALSTSAAVPSPDAKLSVIVSNGQSNFSERLTLRSISAAGATAGTYAPALNPFRGTAGEAGAGTDKGFDVVTFRDLPRAPGVQPQPVLTGDSRTAVLRVEPPSSGSFDCLSFSTVVASTRVQDRDADGLLDVWETSSNLVDAATGQPMPNLAAMGADPLVPDVFVQVDYLYRGMDPGQQNLLPSRQALGWVSNAFKRAPITSRGCLKPSGAFCPIRIHFDVGADVDSVATDDDWAGTQRYSAAKAGACAADWTPDCAIIPAAHSRGGNAIPAATCDDPTPAELAAGARPKLCAFPGPAFAGTVSWKTGFRAHRDSRPGAVDAQGNPVLAPCEPGQPCRFPRERKDIFRYALFAYALGLPSPLRIDGADYFDADGRFVRKFTPPRKTSGIADVGGGDLMVTLGQWDGGKGTPFVQASTLMHELGHLFGLRHGGILDQSMTQRVGTTEFRVVTLDPQPNCKPNYQSVMNYLFQIRGVGDNGTAAVDFSRQALRELDETRLSESLGMGSPLAYDARWYAPLSNSVLDRRLNLSPANAGGRRCDGTPFAVGDVSKDVPYVRIDADPRAPDTPINWNTIGTSTETLTGTAAIDVNLDGKIAYIPPGSNDFLTMDLRQTGARRAIGSQRLAEVIVVPGPNGTFAPFNPVTGPIGGGLSLDTTGYIDASGYGDLGYGDLGYGDLGYGDLGYGDLGYGDLGYGDLGYGDLGYGDLGATFNVQGAGYGDLGYGDLGYGDLGYGDLGYGDLGAPAPDDDRWLLTAGFGDGSVDLETATDLGTSPRNLQATAVRRTVELRWDPPAIGTATYQLFRIEGSVVTDANFATAVQIPIPSTAPTGPVIDANVRNNRTYTYWIVATVQTAEQGQLKTRSNTVTITL